MTPLNPFLVKAGLICSPEGLNDPIQHGAKLHKVMRRGHRTVSSRQKAKDEFCRPVAAFVDGNTSDCTFDCF